MFSDQNLCLLKKYVLLKASIHGLTPSDCKRLAIIISKEVSKNISETTIKRLFGFAEVKHQFSKFTLTALSEYVGKNSWEEFCEDVKDNPKQFVLSKWDELFYKAKSTTSFTLKTIRNKSGIPYKFTVAREFAERNFDHFYNKDYSFTTFVSQPGCGKSILLSHLVEKAFLSDNATYKNDMLWFIDANTLHSSEYFEFDLENWLNEQIGRGQNFINYFNEDPSRRKGKVIIVLDGFDEVSIKKDQLKGLLNRLANFLCANEGNDWIKVVLSLRSTTWIGFYEQIRHSSFLKAKLYTGNQVMMDDYVNVPPLSDKEINQILSKFSDIDVLQINAKLKAQFRFPFYLQVYYQLKEEGKSFDYRTDLTFYELISGFVNEKINLSQHYTEKILLLKKVIVLTKQIKKGNLIYKENLLNDITVFREAYEELLIEGILVEEKLSDHVMPKEVVRFIHPHIYEYFLFIQIIDNNQRNINKDLFEYIKIEFNKTPLRLQLLQWAVRHAIINQNITPVIDALKLKLPTAEKNSLMLFILQVLEFKSINRGNIFTRIIDENLHEAFLHELMQLDLLGPCYKEILRTLKRLTTQPNELLIYGSLLAYVSVLELDIEQLEVEVRDLQNISNISSKWLFKPADAFSVILSRLKNIENPNKDIFILIEKFISQPSPLKKTDITEELTLSYIAVFLVNFLCGSLEDNIKVFNQIKNSHPNVFLKRNGLSVYLLNICVINALRIDSSFNPGRIINLLEKLQENKKYELPDYLNILFLLVRAESSYANENYEKAMSYAEKCLEISKNKNISFLRVLLYIVISNIYDKEEQTENARDIRYKLHCLLEEKSIDIKSFMYYNQGVKMLQ